MLDGFLNTTSITFPEIEACLHEMKQDLRNKTYRGPWAASVLPRKLAALSRLKKLFQDSGEFASSEEYPSSREEVLYFFDTQLDAVSRSRHDRALKEYCTICDVLSGRRDAEIALRAQDDEGAELIAHLTGKRGSPVVYGNYEMIAVCSLVRECRHENLPLSRLTTDAFVTMAKRLRPATLAAVTLGLHRLGPLHRSNLVPQELLPPACRDELPSLTRPAVRVVPPLHAEFAALIARYVEVQAHGRKEVTFGTEVRAIDTEGVGEERVKNIRNALRWLWHGLVVLGGASDADFDVAALSESVIVHDLVDACATGRLGPACDSETRRDRLLIVLAFLDWLRPGFRAEIDKEFFKSAHLRRKAGEEAEGDRMRRESCLGFVRNADLQRKFFTMPNVFFSEARELIADFGSLKRTNEHGISRALLQNSSRKGFTSGIHALRRAA
ncbi:hypothetical protein [Palleronia rufa]|uniref:hypothetical protein n=1 Tax=Palleronia rufa TaxID=1530186 RepID=UPI000561D2AA|nr:hypothetical protein [Palleronia rufa]